VSGLRGFARSFKGRVLLGALAFYLAWQLWLTLAAPAKIAPGIATQAEKVNVLVTLRFAPERFHVLVFQRYGRVSGTQDESVEVRGVKPADVSAIARFYWVRRVEPLI
jgi:hypothetical protein